MTKWMYVLAAVALVNLNACSNITGEPDPSQAADLIFSGGSIVTMDSSQPEAEAVAIKDGKILAVGSVREIGRRLPRQPGGADSRFLSRRHFKQQSLCGNRLRRIDSDTQRWNYRQKKKQQRTFGPYYGNGLVSSRGPYYATRQGTTA